MSALKQIEKKLKSAKQASTELDLSEIKIGRFDQQTKKYLEKFKKVQILILANCQLESLDNLPNWKLTAVQLSNNKLGDSCLAKLASIPSLTQILLVNNNITSLDDLKQLAGLKKLQEVDFSQNQVATKLNYRSTLFDSIKSLEIVDQKDVNGVQPAEQQQFDDDEEEYGDDDEQFSGDEEDDDDYEQEESSEQKPKKKKK